MSSKEDKMIISILTEIATESKTILMAIDDLKIKISNAEKDEVDELMHITLRDIDDNISRLIKNQDIPMSSSPKLELFVANLRDPLEEARKIATNPPSQGLSIHWFNELSEKLKIVHSIAGRAHVLLTFNEVIIKDRRPGWSIKIHEYLHRYLLYQEDRNKVIEEINSRDNLNAFIDEKNDILYVVASGYRSYIQGIGYLLGIFFIGFFIPLIMKNLGYLSDGINLQNEIYIFYILSWIGFAIHILMKSKDVRKENTCLEDIVLWIHIKWQNFAMSAFAVIAGYLFLLNAGQLNMASAIATGFAVDSFGSRILHQYYSDLGKAVEALEEEETNSELVTSVEKEQ